MPAICLAQLQEHAAALIRRAKAGERITIEVDGREVAELTSIKRNRWRPGSEITELFKGPADPDWAHDRAQLDGATGDPFSAW